MAKTSQNMESAKAVDYAENMFEEGHNRTQENSKVRIAPSYTEAAHTPGNEASADHSPAPHAFDTADSRAGTESSGEYDETGGPIGGTERELDDMEATGEPVDRTRRMKE